MNLIVKAVEVVQERVRRLTGQGRSVRWFGRLRLCAWIAPKAEPKPESRQEARAQPAQPPQPKPQQSAQANPQPQAQAEPPKVAGSANASGLILGAQPVVPTGSFESRWSAMR